jgi:hypothetical protein
MSRLVSILDVEILKGGIRGIKQKIFWNLIQESSK